MAQLEQRRGLVLFVGLSYLLAWAWWVPLALGGTTVAPGQGWPTHLVGLMAPSIAALVATGATGGRSSVVDLLRRCVRWRFDRRVYWLVLATAAIGALASMAPGDVDWAGFGRYSGAPAWGPVTVLVVLVVNGFGEEIGWRGFLWDRLLPERGFRDSAVVVWLVWGTWHLPLFWVVASYRDFAPIGVIGWVVSLFFGTVFLGWLYEFSGRSILAVVLWHVVYNFAVATDGSSSWGSAVLSGAVVVAGLVIMRSGGRLPSRAPAEAG
ncbi:MAG: CPBP family intramembrane glutamic endopeptidase [Microthrixaceae bacterium]